MKGLLLLPLVTLFIGLYSCRSIHPEAPVNSSVPLDNIESRNVSYINVPIKINLSPYFDEIEKSVPEKFSGSDQNCEGISYAYTFYRKPIQFQGNGTSLLFDVDGKYSIKLNYCPQCVDLVGNGPACIIPRIYASCGVNEALPKMKINFSTQIKVGNDYHLKANTKLKDVKAISPCEITVFEYDATSKIEEEVRKALKDLEKTIDKEISKVDLTSQLQSTWEILCSPTDLNGFGYLCLNPETVSISDIHFKGKIAQFNAVLGTKPTIYLSDPGQESSILPKLGNNTGKEGFDILVDIVANYDSLSSKLTSSISGKKIELKGREVIFDSIRVCGANNNSLNLEVAFSGKKKGIFYLTGTPVFDINTQRISLENLTFDIKTKSALLKSAKWLFDERITENLSTYSLVDLGPYLDTLKQTVSGSLNSEIQPNIFMNGSVDHLKILKLHPLNESLFIRINLLGKLEISM